MSDPTTPDPLTATGPAHALRAVPDDAVLDVLRGWVQAQRWFPAKGTDAAVERVGVLELADPAGEAAVAVHLLRVGSSGTLLQVPVVLRATGTALPESARTIATTPDGVLVDGPGDPAFLRAWLAAAEHDVAVDPVLDGARPLSGEQSNSSVLLPGTRPPAILKVFRGVSPGANPDVDVPLGLSRVGWDGVPRPLAWLSASWPGGDGHLGVLSELVAGARDGFELACEQARAGEGFGDLAEDLGRTTAQMHRALRAALPTPDGPAPAAEVVATLRARAASAVAAAPVLASRADAVERVLAAVEALGQLPPRQRVHGDYHLGQVLLSADARWKVLDFEGEPQASVAERTRPDLALRDLAGMLRSMDYAAAVGGADTPTWAEQAPPRLVAGYEAEAGAALQGADVDLLLRALELDKALYEVVYEVRNRPDWVAIPLDGVDRLLAEP